MLAMTFSVDPCAPRLFDLKNTTLTFAQAGNLPLHNRDHVTSSHLANAKKRAGATTNSDLVATLLTISYFFSG